MAGRKRRSGVWHHRVPDFKLVYCGLNERVPKKGTKLRGRRVKVSVNADEDTMLLAGDWNNRRYSDNDLQQH